MGKVVSLLNMKGGVGKTTLAVNLAHYCYYFLRSNVLLVDLDPQFNASQYLMDYKAYELHRKNSGTIADLLINNAGGLSRTERKAPKKKITDCVYQYGHRFRKNFDLLPSELNLSHVVKNPAQMDFRLEKLIEPVREKYDYIFIDCAPTDSVLTTMSLTASDYILIPVRPDKFSILGYALLKQTLELFKENSYDPHSVEVLGTVFTQVSASGGPEASCMNEIRKLAHADDSYVFKSSLPVSRTFITAVQNQTPAYQTKFARTELKASIHGIANEMTKRIQSLSEENDEER